MNWTYSTHSQNRDVYAIEDSGEMAVIWATMNTVALVITHAQRWSASANKWAPFFNPLKCEASANSTEERVLQHVNWVHNTHNDSPSSSLCS
jgi:hypothetical protein